ncbi:hypothetical protein [Plesiomonas shigelloides]|uniref:HNH endonuclease 5 domain-containing protein n=1 Tax=Plesiomonas shigelloides 302-73 TaxID=1315976 RepID=R8AQT1_PLESH|nr:hypothetical protein [Plesiomonas shigelloides]EON88690.1 hypothetical protein PLESHI_09319 [Plesiomonas shigelloides 302-73]
MQVVAHCRLCEKEKELKLSHIIPRSFIKRRKQNGKTVLYTVGKGAVTGIYDPKELLLCHECEQFLSKEFESYGIDLLRNKKNVSKVSGGVIFNNFNYSKFYLFLISILWRASISSIETFKQVDLCPEYNELIRSCLLKKSLKIQTSIRLPHVIKIAMIRVVDVKNELGDELLKGALLNVNRKSSHDQICYYFMVEGFLFVYDFTLPKDLHELRCDRIYAQLTDSSKLFVPTCDFRNLSQIYNAFACMANEAKNNITKNSTGTF